MGFAPAVIIGDWLSNFKKFTILQMAKLFIFLLEFSLMRRETYSTPILCYDFIFLSSPKDNSSITFLSRLTNDSPFPDILS